MGLTKKNYVAIAKIIKERKEDIIDQAIVYGIEFITQDLADYFATDNPLFDKKRFLIACGVEE